MFHTYVTTIYSKCFNCFSLMLQQVVFMFQVFYDILCVSHSCCKCMFQIFHLFLVLCCKCFMLFGRGEPEVGGGARGALGGWQMGALGRGTGVLQVKARWRRARPWPVIPTPECHPRGESERERWGLEEGPAGAETRVECTHGAGRRRMGAFR